MRTLALDVGTRRTGIAFLDDAVGVPVALDTFRHDRFDALVRHVERLVRERSIHRVVVGLPLLLSGREGRQARIVRSVAAMLEKPGLDIVLEDERYTTPAENGIDRDAAAAVALLN